MNNIKLAGVFVPRIVLAALFLGLASTSHAQLTPPPNDLVPIAVADVPDTVCNYYSLQPWRPPLPFNWLADETNILLYVSPSTGTNAIWVGDADIDYAQRAAEAEVLTLAVQVASGRLSLAQNFQTQNTQSSYDPSIDLWLEITNVADGLAYFNLWNGTNQVYAIWAAPNPLGPWTVETEVWPTNGEVAPFTLPASGQDALFAFAQDWTGVTANGNTVPEWWFWQYFGTLGLSDTNVDSQGNTLLSDYQNGTDPNIISFSISVTNVFVQALSVPVQLNLTAGTPFYVAISVDDTNYAANANWQRFGGTSLTADVGPNEGWHDIRIGLRGFSAFATQTWQQQRIKLDLTPPSLIITNPVTSTVDVPIIQLQGYCPESLARISCNLSNAAGLRTNQQVLVVDQAYSTNTCEFTTTRFQAFDVSLTNGLNTFTLYATDLAGNVTATNFNITVDYSSKTNPPAVQVYWPLNGVAVCGAGFACNGWVSDPTASIVVRATDTNGGYSELNAAVGRDGKFWSPTFPLNATSLLTLTATDAAGNVATTNLTVTQASMSGQGIGIISIDPVSAGQTTATGGITAGGYTVWVNGSRATNNGNGTWTAQIASIGVGGGTVEAMAIPNSDNGGAGSSAHSASGNPTPSPGDTSAQAVQQEVAAPAGVFLSEYHVDDEWNGQIEVSNQDGTNMITTAATQYSRFNWQDAQGADGDYLTYFWGIIVFPITVESACPPTSWPQPLPGTTETVLYWDGYTETNELGPPLLKQEHCDIGICGNDGGYPFSEHRTADATMKLVTGGPPGSRQLNLWCLSAWATAYTNLDDTTGTPVPPEQIQIGSFGNQDTNAELWVLLPDGDPDITPKINGKPNYIFGVGAQKFGLISQTVCATPTNQARTTLGVGEEVNILLWNVTLNCALPANAAALVRWTTSAGSVYPTNGSLTTLTAPSSPATATVTMSYKSVAYPPINYSVIKPSGISATLRGQPDPFTPPAMGAGMHMDVVLQPTNVSFYRVQIIEPVANATNRTGCFTNTVPPNHDSTHGAGKWHSVVCNNLISDLDFDHAACFGGPVGQAGSYTWPISPLWQVVGDTTSNALSGWTDQVHTLDSDGTTTVEKLGHHVTRHTSETRGTAQ